MDNNVRKMLCIMLSICFMLIQPLSASAVGLELDNTQTFEISTQVPPEAKEFANEHYLDVIEVYATYSDGTFEKDEKYELGEPFVIYSPAEENQEELYYFPIFCNRKVILNISVINTSKGWTLSASKELVDELNQLGYYSGESVIFYESGNQIIAQSKNYRRAIMELTQSLNKKESIKAIETEKFETLNFEEKRNKIVQKIRERRAVNLEQMQAAIMSKNISESYTPTFSNDTSNSKECQLYNPKGQGTLPICWAASVATIVNYRKGTNYTAKNVCDAIGVPYDGNTISTKKEALSHYNIEYSIRRAQLSLAKIKTNINNKYPIAASTISSDGSGHAITVYGYRMISTSDYIIFWNSGLEYAQVVYYVGSGTTYTYNNQTWTWTMSLAKYI